VPLVSEVIDAQRERAPARSLKSCDEHRARRGELPHEGDAVLSGTESRGSTTDAAQREGDVVVRRR
jgi:hypothetical protein